MENFKKIFKRRPTDLPGYTQAPVASDLLGILADAGLLSRGIKPSYQNEIQKADDDAYQNYFENKKQDDLLNQQAFTNQLNQKREIRDADKYDRENQESIAARKLYSTEYPEVNIDNLAGQDAEDYAKYQMLKSKYEKDEERSRNFQAMRQKALNRLARNDEENAKERIINRVNSDKPMKDNYNMYQSTNRVKSILELGNPIGDASVTTFMAKASGEVGALSEADKRPYGGSQAFNAKFQQAALNYAKGTLTDENRQFLMQLADTMGSKAQSNMKQRATQMSKQYGQLRDFTPEQIIDLVGYEDLSQDESQIRRQEKALEDMTEEELDAYIAENQ